MTFKTALIASCLALSATTTFAQAQPASAADTAQAKPVAGAMTDAEIRKVDKEARKLTIKHGEIKNLEMPPMTMVFQVKDPAMLDAVKQGDKVQFRAERTGGALVVTDLQPSDAAIPTG
jgi:Cu/Ag efflux protein CusF